MDQMESTGSAKGGEGLYALSAKGMGQFEPARTRRICQELVPEGTDQGVGIQKFLDMEHSPLTQDLRHY